MRRAKLNLKQTFFLTTLIMVSTVGAQDFPWKNRSWYLSWRIVEPMPEPQRLQIKQRNSDMTISVSRDGTVSIFNSNEIRQLRFGLPGRPISMWRDAGQSITSFGRFAFPSQTPLSTNFKSTAKETSDFLNNLAGLLWILDDGEEYLTIVHSATYRYAFIPLPAIRDFELRFHPDRLELCKRSLVDSVLHSWALSWNELLPVLQELAQHSPPPPRGNAIVPYPL
ncbi:MAG: hypothetical protein LBH03_07795 [Holophagales bacterium]|jgi:hypothetical protein|nr:hypothetical protein [Holophagales bacterium]